MHSRILVLTSLLFAWEARAQTPLVLSWQAPAGCPEQHTVEREVLRLAALGADSTHRVLAAANIEHRGEHDYRLQLSAELDGVAGHRSFQGQSCQGVVDAAILTLALMLNPEAEVRAGSRSEPGTPGPVSGPAPIPQATPTLPPAPAPAISGAASTEPGWPSHLLLALSLGLTSGVMPKLAVEPRLEAALALGPLFFGVGAGLMPAQSVSAGDADSPAGARIWEHSLGARLGWMAQIEPVWVGPLVGVELTRMQARGTGVSDPEHGTIRFVSVAVGALGTWLFSEHFGLQAGLEARLPLRRPSFVMDELGELHQPQSVGIRGYFGVVLAVW